jgi:hypothetical protein
LTEGKQNHGNLLQQTLSTMIHQTGDTSAHKTEDNNTGRITNHDVTAIVPNNNTNNNSPDKFHHTQSLDNLSIDASITKSKIPDNSQPEMDKYKVFPAKPSHTTNASSQTYKIPSIDDTCRLVPINKTNFDLSFDTAGLIVTKASKIAPSFSLFKTSISLTGLCIGLLPISDILNQCIIATTPLNATRAQQFYRILAKHKQEIHTRNQRGQLTHVFPLRPRTPHLTTLTQIP